MLSDQLTLGTLVIIIAVMFHIAGLVGLAKLLRRFGSLGKNTKAGSILIVAFTVLVIIGIHTAEAWAWAFIYFSLGEFTDFSTALYFSVVTSTTLGYGDITLSDSWRILGTFESMAGLILFGTSTAFLFGLLRRLFFDDENTG